MDRYGHAHISPFGVSVGKSLSSVSYSVTGNWLMQNQKPTEQQLNNFLTGHGFNFGGGAGFGGSESYTPGSGWAMGTGYYSPQIGGSYNYTPSWGFLNPSTNLKW